MEQQLLLKVNKNVKENVNFSVLFLLIIKQYLAKA